MVLARTSLVQVLLASLIFSFSFCPLQLRASLCRRLHQGAHKVASLPREKEVRLIVGIYCRHGVEARLILGLLRLLLCCT